MAQWFARQLGGKKLDVAPASELLGAPPPAAQTEEAAAHQPVSPQPVKFEVGSHPVALEHPPDGGSQAVLAPVGPPPVALTITAYNMKQTLGVGAFGKVKLAELKATGELFAIKCIQKSRLSAARQFERLQREIRILKMLRHPNVIQLHAVIETEAEIYLVMEHVSGGDLLDFINNRGAMPEDQARDLVTQITRGLQFCHSLGVAHRDLKPENILINEAGIVKITDFGLSNLQDAGEQLSTLCGSPYYAAPELLDGSTTQYDGTEADIWSVGVITFAILCGELPFDGQTLPDLFAKITAGVYKIPPQLQLSSECTDVLACMLVRAPNGRMKMNVLRQHPWMQGGSSIEAGSRLKRRGNHAISITAGSKSKPGLCAKELTDLERGALESSWRERNLGGAVGRVREPLARSLSAEDIPPRQPASLRNSAVS